MRSGRNSCTSSRVALKRAGVCSGRPQIRSTFTLSKAASRSPSMACRSCWAGTTRFTARCTSGLAS